MVLPSSAGVDASAVLPGCVQSAPDGMFRVSGNALGWCRTFLTQPPEAWAGCQLSTRSGHGVGRNRRRRFRRYPKNMIQIGGIRCNHRQQQCFSWERREPRQGTEMWLGWGVLEGSIWMIAFDP